MDRDKTHITKDNQLGTLNFMSPESIQVSWSFAESAAHRILACIQFDQIGCFFTIWALFKPWAQIFVGKI